MTLDRRKLRWHRWGWSEGSFDLGGREDAVWAWIRDTLGLASFESRPACSLESIDVRPPGLSDAVLDALREVVGADSV